jgi:sulfotransferase family protein
MPKCNLIIPGFPKSGTASLHSYLALHPDICMSEPKEPSFFAVSEAWNRGIEWYDKFFENHDRSPQWYGESSTLYCMWEPALERIKQLLHNPRFIVLLRHPVHRLTSHYKWYWAYGWESRPILRAVEEDEESGFHPDKPMRYLDVPGASWVNPCGGYKRASQYSYFCPIMERLFGKENILYLDNEQLAREPQNTMNRCFRFLEIVEYNVPAPLRVNATDDVRLSRTLGLHLLLKPFPKRLRDSLDPGGRLRRRVHRMLGQKKRKPPKVTDRDKGYLESLLAEDIAFYESMFSKSR